jgi:hypothetical protein
MDAIKHLQERPHKQMIKYESTQTAQVSLISPPDPPDPPKTPTTRTDSSRSTSSRKSSVTPKLPSDFIQPNTPVYAVWLEDDGLVYEVC